MLKTNTLFASLLFTYLLAEGVASADDLLSVYQLALKNDPTFAAAAASRDSALEVLPQARSNLLPNASLELDLNHNRWQSLYKDPTLASRVLGTPTQVYDYPSRTFSLNITQPIYHYESIVALRQSKLQAKQAGLDYSAARQDLMARVSQSYFSVLSARDALETAKAQKEAVSRQLEQSKQRFAVGLIAITDVHDAQASYDSALAQEIAAENQLSNAQETLRAITGSNLDKIAVLSDKLPLVPPDPADMERWTSTALSQNLTLESAKLQIEVVHQQIDVQKSGHYPRVDLLGSFQNSATNGGGSYGGTDSWNASIGLRVILPLYQGGAVDSRIRQSEADYARAREQLEQRRRSIEMTTHNSYLGVITGISQVKALKQAVISNQSAIEATEAGYQVGTRTIVDVLNSQRLLYAAQRDYSNARYNYVLYGIVLKQAAGQLSESDLAAISNWLEASAAPSSKP